MRKDLKELADKLYVVMLLMVPSLFIVSPIMQMIARYIDYNYTTYNDSWVLGENYRYDKSQFSNCYRDMIDSVNSVGIKIACVILIYCIVRAYKTKKIDIKWLKPMLIFLIFDMVIIAVTLIRGMGPYDRYGHSYMGESVFSYLSYPVVYFFTGMLICKEKYRKYLLYMFMFTGSVVNAISLYSEWGKTIKYFEYDTANCSVFHNTNHYGYYIAMTLIATALLFLYEKKMWLRLYEYFAFIIGAYILIINNTLGAWLAVMFSLFCAAVYLWRNRNEDRYRNMWKWAVFEIGYMLILTVGMSFSYDTILSSILKLFFDIDNIASGSESAGSAGSGRWRLWTGTVRNLVKNPILGFGVEGLLSKGVGTPHNEILQYAAFFGVITAALYIAACTVVLKRVGLKLKKVSVTTWIFFFITVTYLVSSMVGVAIYYTTPFLYIFLGLTYGGYKESVDF